jgi:DNA-binding LytR/AlgR family response regulator
MNSSLISTLYYGYNHRLPVPWPMVSRLEGRGNYTVFVLNSGLQQISSKSLCIYEPHLPTDFIRIHKSCIVRQNSIMSIDRVNKKIVLKDGISMKVARRRWPQVLNSLIPN